MSVSSCLRIRRISRDTQADTGFVRSTAVVSRDATKLSRALGTSTNKLMRDFRLPPRCIDLLSFEILPRVIDKLLPAFRVNLLVPPSNGTDRLLVVPKRPLEAFGSTYRSHLQMGQICCWLFRNVLSKLSG